jgi:hypothetical protein
MLTSRAIVSNAFEARSTLSGSSALAMAAALAHKMIATTIRNRFIEQLSSP